MCSVIRSGSAEEKCSFSYCCTIFFFLLRQKGDSCRGGGGGCCVDTGVGSLVCSPSLNSPRSNLQTAAEFWQILPWCLLPLGDTFFIYFSSPPFWYLLHWSTGPSSDCQFCSSSMSEKPNGFTGFTVNPSLFSGFMNVAYSQISSLLFPRYPSMSLWWLGHSCGCCLVKSFTDAATIGRDLCPI